MAGVVDSVGPTSSYVTPPWPSLAFFTGPQTSQTILPILWYREDMVKFTLLWTVSIFFVVYTSAGAVALVMFHRHQAGIILLLGLSFCGVITGAVSGSIVGALLASFYVTGYISMPTWVPLAWAILQAFMVIIFSYSQVAFLAL
ncbi:hypothetical protein BASA50_003235 [Batrachochytrium salamandrivorans]|uniref:Uncharacterized protein n=1 Tax=Batrachochytrium salamandrivorans TaxID=1357716 RepID=A0ABQ8FJ83_9FUNG|nr:hypothetical protein BASA60_000022 [Batrachochytrium salamandrivorans]KAH6563462.1 hypothetical protein BASA62_008557 [Batrachochytrium salamandrivorans]KAH6599206.1 hypothetical protein BASA50_003235 [Batrachochytrium salamandrivorans]KAH6601852.1 hypothetical protein BASA61_001746 [Batrachochytrium salamandrivorans]KAH9269196.1 hypothetical protein BASA83_008821 [Batrachochytrium salamandrivorans]